MLRQCPGERRDVSNRQVSNRQNADKRLARLTTGKRLTRMSSDLLTSDVGVARHGLAHFHARILLVPVGFSP